MLRKMIVLQLRRSCQIHHMYLHGHLRSSLITHTYVRFIQRMDCMPPIFISRIRLSLRTSNFYYASKISLHASKFRNTHPGFTTRIQNFITLIQISFLESNISLHASTFRNTHPEFITRIQNFITRIQISLHESKCHYIGPTSKTSAHHSLHLPTSVYMMRVSGLFSLLSWNRM